MDPVTLTALLGQSSNLIPSLFQSGLGIAQLFGAKKLGDNYKRPQYEIPEGFLSSVGIMKDLASQRELPGARRITEGLEKTQADSLSTLKEAASSPGELLSGLQKITNVTEEKQKDLGVAGEQYYAQNQDKLTALLGKLGEYQDMQWTINKYMPYLQAMEAAKNLSGAGTSNVYSGLGNTVGVGQNMLSTLSSDKDFLSMFSRGMKENSHLMDVPASLKPKEANLSHSVPGL